MKRFGTRFRLGARSPLGETVPNGRLLYMPDFTEDSIGNWVSDFCQSDAVKLFPGAVAESSQSILETLLRTSCGLRKVTPENLVEADCRHGLLAGVAELNLTDECRSFVPSLCRAFFEDMQKRGRTGNGLTIGRYLGALKQAYLDASSNKGITYQRPGSKIGRNDLCPCGSGKKYKKCCGNESSKEL